MALSTSNKLFANFIIKLLLALVVICSGVVLFVLNREYTTFVEQKEQRIAHLIEINDALQKVNYAYLNALKGESADQLDVLKTGLRELSTKKRLLSAFKNDNEMYSAEVEEIEVALNEEASFYAQQAELLALTPDVVSLNSAFSRNTGITQPLLSQLIQLERAELKSRATKEVGFFEVLEGFLVGIACLLLLMIIVFYFRSQKRMDKQDTDERQRDHVKQTTQSVHNAKSEYLAMISHEIRTPMNGVLGMSNLLLQSSLTKEQQDYATTIHDSAESLLRIVNDVLDFSKIEAGTIHLEEESVNIRDLIAQVFIKLPDTTPSLNISYHVNENVPDFINCDPVRLRQILYNFLGNAVKFTDFGSVTLDCKVIDKDENGRMRLGFVIKDTGIGIAEEKIKMLFRPFVQVGDTNTRKYGGSGLGLNIVYNLITMMNGKVKVKSELGSGSIFTFYIGTQEREKSEKRQSSPQETVKITLDNELSTNYPFKILVVDDNEINLMLITRTLSKLGYECKKGSNGQMAVDMAKKEQFDLIFMDMQMPIMDGTDATTEIRKHYRVYEYPVVIALTANALGDGKDKCLEAGMQDFIAKPFKPAEIEAVIKKWAPKIIDYRTKHQANL